MGKKNNKNEPPSLFDNLDLFSMAGSQKAVQPESFEETAAPAKEQPQKKEAAQSKKEGSIVHPVKEDGSKPKNRRRYYHGKPRNKGGEGQS